MCCSFTMLLTNSAFMVPRAMCADYASNIQRHAFARLVHAFAILEKQLYNSCMGVYAKFNT